MTAEDGGTVEPRRIVYVLFVEQIGLVSTLRGCPMSTPSAGYPSKTGLERRDRRENQ
jgi:hypothetical protein